jgi:GxxExxY protein|tara:strand:- start:12 stop:497 length:486 start_codon:yes stop_codon:yes gene_type:complete
MTENMTENMNTTNDNHSLDDNKYDYDSINNNIIDACKRVYTCLGCGHSEKIYHKALIYELGCLNYNIDTEKNIIVKYIDSHGYSHNLESERIDIFIHKYNIILELKAIQKPIQQQEINQIKKYFNELNKLKEPVYYGLIINFPQPNSKVIPTSIEYNIIKN